MAQLAGRRSLYFALPDMSEDSDRLKKPDEQHDGNDLRIVLLGVSGAGKSPTANAILGREAFEESSTRESEIQRGRVEDRNISIIDTPGFFNSQLTDEELQKQMMKSVSLSDPGPHAFLLIIDLETCREEPRNVVEQIQKNFGDQAMRFTMVLFIGREKILKKDWIQISESENIKELLNYFEGRYHLINSKSECDLYQITTLLKSIDEMVKNNGGQLYSHAGCHKDVRKQMESQKEMKGLIQKIARERSLIKLDLRIVLLGKTGSGKSSTGNTIIGGFEFEQGVSTKSVTRQCQRHVTAVEEDKTISVIDTPGLYDTEMSEEELKKEIVKCIYMSAPGPHVFLLVIRLGVRFTEEEKKTVKWIQKHFGGKASQHTIILFTHTDHLKGLSLDDYISERNDLKALVNECGGRFHSFNNEDMSNRSQVTELLQKIDEMVRINGGQHYTNDRFQEAQRRIEQEASKQKLEVNVQTALTAAGGGVVVVGAAVGAAALGVAVVLVGAGLGMIVSLFVGAAVGGAIALGAVVGVAAALGVVLRRAGGEGGAVGVAVGWAVVVGLAVGAGVGGVVVGGVVGVEVVEVENKGIVSVAVAVSVVGGVVAAIAAAAATFAIAKRK